MAKKPKKLTYSLAETAAALGYSERTIRRRVDVARGVIAFASGHTLPIIQAATSGHIRIPAAAVERLAEAAS